MEWMSPSRISSGGIVFSAISRRAITGFLSLSGSIVTEEPLAIDRARCAASSTSSKRLGILSTQSSTVTRAMRKALSPRWYDLWWYDYRGTIMHTNPTSENRLPGHLWLSPPLVACRARKIKDLPHGGARRRAKSRKEGTRAYAEHGMAPMALDLEQRHEHKCPRVHFRVGQDQPVWRAPARWPTQSATPEVEHVDIKTARPPMAG